MKSSYRQILFLLKPYRSSIILAIILSLLPAYFKVWLPYLLGKAIDEGISANNYQIFILIAGTFLGIQILVFVLEAITNFFLIRFGLRILVEYRMDLLKRIFSYPIQFFDRISAGTVATRLTNDVNSLQELFSSALIILVGNAIMMLGVLIAMFLLNWQLALISCIVLPPLVWVMKIFQVRVRRRFGFSRKALSNLNSYSGESFTGVSDIRGLGAREANRNEFKIMSAKYADRHLQGAREYTTFNPIIYLLMNLMSVLILVYGTFAFNRQMMSVGEIVAFLTYSNFFAWPLQEFAEKYTVLQQALASVDRLMEISSHPSEKNEGKFTPSNFQKIRFENVSFRYQTAEQEALKNISFEVNRGEKVALIGETGAGKSTTCSLLMRFYDPTAGRIFLDNKALQDFELHQLRRRIGWVSQDVTLFSTSLRENLRFYDGQINDDQIWNLLEIIQLADWVRSLPEGLDEILSERATSISSGQRQLISVARALLPRPQIFIFDEATSHVDSHTEHLVQESLEKLWRSEEFRGITGFVIAHRLSTIRRCDRIFVFKEAQIVEEGSFQDLMNLRGYAHQLQQKQYGVSASL